MIWAVLAAAVAAAAGDASCDTPTH
eukprot:SAG31_NODE_14936_length_779_cov_1.294118_1_plen_24_part_01